MSGGLTIRNYGAEDLGAVVELWRLCGLVVPQNDPVVDIQKKIDFQPELFFVSELELDNDSDIGGITGTVMAGYEGHRGWINYLAVHPRLQRSGVGTMLMQEACAHLKKLGCQKVNLQVRRTNSDVLAFYQSLGFKEDDVRSLGYRFDSDGNR